MIHDSAKCFFCGNEIGWKPREFTELGRIYCSQECLEKRRERK